MKIDPEIGFTSGVITDPNRFVGRSDVIKDLVNGVNTPLGMIAIYGSRGVGKSSILRQVQQIALGDYSLVESAGLAKIRPSRERKFLTVFYTCDKLIESGTDLLTRLCNDQNSEDGLLRLLPQDGKELVEFTRSKEVSLGADLKVVNWGTKGVESSKYARTVPGDIVQTFRNYIDAILTHQVRGRMKRDGLLIFLDEFDVIRNKDGLGSLIKSLSSPEVKFAVSGIGSDLSDLVYDHASVERLLEEGAIHLLPMSSQESMQIVSKAEELFSGQIFFDENVKFKIATLCQGYPYLVQLFGKECVRIAASSNNAQVTLETLNILLGEIRDGRAFPTLESQYQRAIGDSRSRQLLLHLLAEQKDELASRTGEHGPVYLAKIRDDAKGLEVQHIDQLIPRLVESKYGPVLRKEFERPGVYSFVNPTLRIYIALRHLD